MEIFKDDYKFMDHDDVDLFVRTAEPRRWMASKVPTENKSHQKSKKKRKSVKRLSKKNLYKSVINYGPYLCKLLKKQDPKLSLSVKTTNILNSFGSDMLDRIVAQASLLAKYTNHKTINAKEIQSAARLVLPPGLACEATQFGITAVKNYYLSKKENCSVAMTKDSNKREVWVKCYSTTKNLIYYWRTVTRESIWEANINDVLEGRPNVKIIDSTEQMKRGEKPVFNMEELEELEEGEEILVNNQQHQQQANIPPTSSNGARQADDDDDDDDDEDFNESMNAFCKSSPSSSSICGSQGSFNRYEVSAGSVRRHSEPSSKSTVTKNTIDGRKSTENPPVKIPTPSTSSRPPAKRRSSDTSTSSLQSSDTSLAKIQKKETKLSSQKRHKTPIQDRKIKEFQEFLMKQKQKNSGRDAESSSDNVAGVSGTQASIQKSVNGNAGMPHNMRKFVIPKRKTCDKTGEQDSGTQPQRSPLEQETPTPEVSDPYRMPLKNQQRTQKRTETFTSKSRNMPHAQSDRRTSNQSDRRTSNQSDGRTSNQSDGRTSNQSDRRTSNQSDRRTSDNWVNTVWNTPPPVLAGAVGMATSPVFAHGPLLMPPAPVQVRSPFLPTPPLSERVQDTQFKNPSPVVPRIIRRVMTQPESPTKESFGTESDSVKRSPVKESSETNVDSFKRSLDKESSATNSDSIKVQEPVIGEFKGPSPVLGIRMLRGTRKSSEETNKTSKAAQDAVNSQFTDFSRFMIKRTMNNSNGMQDNNKTKHDSNKVQEPVIGEFKGPLPVSRKQILRSTRKSSEEINKTEPSSPVSLPATRKRVNDEDDSDSSDDEDTANFKRNKSFTDSESGTTFTTATSTHANRQPLSMLGQRQRGTCTQSSSSSGRTLITMTPTPALRPGVDVPMTGPNQNETSGQSMASSEHTLRATIMPTPNLGPGVFDARQILNRRRESNMSGETANKPSCSNQDDNSMEWEPIEPTQGNVAEKQSSSFAMSKIHYKPLVIVCDTNVLIRDMKLIEEMLFGTLLGIPVKLVIPYQVFKELDRMKQGASSSPLDVVVNAKNAIRLINGRTHSKYSSDYNLEMQDMSMHKEKTEGQHLELESNDDYILNCALQYKAAHGDDKVVVLLTGDKHLLSHATLAHVISQSPENLKAWARGYKEETRTQLLGLNHPTNPEIKMEVDSDPLVPSCSFEAQSCNDIPIGKSETVECYAKSLSDELQQFLKSVIDKCNEKMYGPLKKFASQPKPTWTVLTCLSQVLRRWDIITGKRLDPATSSVIKQIITLAKKCNMGKEVFTNNDMKVYFTSCQTLVKQLGQQYDDRLFLTKLIAMFEEWEQRSLSRPVSPSEDDPQPADMALQNIYNCMRSDYASYKEVVEKGMYGERKQELEEHLRNFYQKVTTILRVVKSGLNDHPQSSLSVDDNCILDFLKQTTIFKAEDGNLLAFEITKENILLLFKENNLRKGVEKMLEKIRRLQSDVMDLMEEISGSDDDFD